MAQTVVLITGANRGIGKGLVQQYLARPNHTVIGTVRDPSRASLLNELPRSEGSSLVLIKFDVTKQSDALAAVADIQAQGIDHIDIVIANAGVCYAYPKVSEVTIEDLQGHFVPNVHGLLFTYQATLPLLRKSNNGKWITMGSSAAWLEVGPISPIIQTARSMLLIWTLESARYSQRSLCPHEAGWSLADQGHSS